MPNILDEYLVRLGAVVDQSGMARFHNALRETGFFVEAQSARMAGSFLKAQVEIVSGFAAIGSAALGLVDKVAMDDQEYRLFALHMYMSKDAARSLKIAMDALGQPLENLSWDTELRERTRQLIEDQRAMAPGGDFNEQMRKIRDIRFEFTRMEVEIQYLGMHVVQDFLKALGLGPDTLLTKLRELNNWFIKDMPAISKSLATWFVPIWKDVVMVMTSVWQVIKSVGTAFTNLMGVLFFDNKLESATFDIKKFGMALEYVAGALGMVATIVDVVLDTAAHLASILANIITMQWDKIPGNVADLFSDYGADIHNLKSMAGSMAESRAQLLGGGEAAGGTAGGFDVNSIASAAGVPPDLMHAIMMQESGGHQYAAGGGTLLGAPTRTGQAMGLMQLMPATAAHYGVNPNDPTGNMKGGAMYLRDLLNHYGGNVPESIGGYAMGQGRMDSFLAGKATLSDEARNEIAHVLGRMGQSGSVNVGGITINIVQPGAGYHEVKRAAIDAMKEHADKQTQRNLLEFKQVYGVSY
jgi:hypothetical protein